MLKMRSKPITALLLTVVLLLTALPTATVSAVDLPSYTAQWPSFRGNADNNAVIAAKTPRTASETTLNWTYTLKAADDWTTAVSDPIMVNEQLYLAVGDELRVLDSDGQLIDQATLAGDIDYTCRPFYLDGLILVPLSNGRLQALTADTLETVWTSDALPSYEIDGLHYDHQSMTTLTGGDGTVYLGTVCVGWAESFTGVYRCIDMTDGTVRWTYTNPAAGYYWSGAVLINDAVLFAGDDGILTALNASDGTEIDRLDLGAAVRSTLVLNENDVLAVSRDGTLHNVAVEPDGSLGSHTSVAFASSSTSTPAVVGDQAVVGGQSTGMEGLLCVIDLDTMTVTQSVSAPAVVQGSPLLSTGYSGNVYAYYTANTTPGGLYVLPLGMAQTQSKNLYTPAADAQNYCMASPIADPDGNLYYTNDSGTLFSVGIKEDGPETPEVPETPEAPDPEITITLNKTSASLLRKETLALKAAVTPATSVQSAVTWNSSDTNVATVAKNGMVTAKRPGTVKITASFGGKTAVCTVTVTAYTTLRIQHTRAVTDGKRVQMDSWGTRPLIIRGRTMVPLRFMAEHMGAKVKYVNDDTPVTVIYGDITMEFRFNSKTMRVITGNKIRTVMLDTAAQKIGGRTLVPVRAACEALGFQVYYEDDTKLIVISNPRMSIALRQARLKEGQTALRFD